MDVNMVLTIPVEFRAPTEDITELALGAECAMVEKPENPGTNMKPLFIWGDLDGMSIGHMHIDGGDPTKEKWIICKELMVGSKTMPPYFFVVDMKEC
jgi:hypothetical protein